MYLWLGNEEGVHEARPPGTLQTRGNPALRRQRTAREIGGKLLSDPHTDIGLAGSHRAVIKTGVGGLFMRRISTAFEVILSLTLLILGLYMLYEGSLNKSASVTAILIGGAVCLTLSVMTLTSAVKSILWHRRMLRHAMPKHDLGSAASENHRG